MSCTISSSETVAAPRSSRKRPMTFTAPPPPQKAARTLRRTGSYLSLEAMQAAEETTLYGRAGAPQPKERLTNVPSTRSLRHYKEERERRKASLRSTPTVIQTPSTSTPPPPPVPSASPCMAAPRPRTSSPLAPKQTALPARAAFPRSKPQPDLYRMAITTRMRMSPEGRKILYMGPRLALSMYTANRELEKSLFSATNELEQIVAAQRETDNDVVMADTDGSLAKSWVVVPQEDWEMIDCSA
ncbi:hypothetical protein WOLCODRAFT_25280 [Wolfiporia cocos MD-104 SS10]|uniref:Uncharacterized protein n=1 Tax=Wolfiporia cocos (strain MD-104) TaxID=742152 RepID=A0A2H3JJC9_WOLCO|nr:hypothetical protein WOLCODRAFT_25280 [Wolfiporia cocos MD-104 SS10]